MKNYENGRGGLSLKIFKQKHLSGVSRVSALVGVVPVQVSQDLLVPDPAVTAQKIRINAVGVGRPPGVRVDLISFGEPPERPWRDADHTAHFTRPIAGPDRQASLGQHLLELFI